MSPVAEAIKELGTLVLGAATLATSIGALVQVFKTKKLVNDRSNQLHEALQYKGMVKGIEIAKEDARADRKELLEAVRPKEDPK